MSMKKRVGKLLIGKKDGKTLLEKMLGDNDDKKKVRSEDSIYNPLQLAIKDMVELTFEEAGTYEIFKIAAYMSRLADKNYQSVRYFLRDTVEVEEPESLVLELMKSGREEEPEKYLFHILEEFGYNEEFMELLEDDVFVITEETEDEEEIEKEYERTYHVTSQVKIIREDRELKPGEIETWNYELKDEMETYYLTIEMDTDDGWTTLYEGRKLLEGEIEIYRLSGGES